MTEGCAQKAAEGEGKTDRDESFTPKLSESGTRGTTWLWVAIRERKTSAEVQHLEGVCAGSLCPRPVEMGGRNASRQGLRTSV